MDRRKFLRVGGVVAASSLAGCSGMLDSAQPEKAREHISVAEKKMVTNTEKMNEIRATFTSDSETPPATFDPNPTKKRVERANAALDDAEEYATDDQKAYVENLRHLGEYQVSRAKLYEDYVVLLDELRGTGEYLNSNRYDEALSALDRGSSRVENVRTHADAAKDAVDAMNPDELGEESPVAYETIKDGIEKQMKEVDFLEFMVDGYVHFVEGGKDFGAASTTYQREEYGTAAEQFGEAQTHFSDAGEEFAKLSDSDPELSISTVQVAQLTCYGEQFPEAARLLKESAEAAENGRNEVARQKATDAQEALQSCNY